MTIISQPTLWCLIRITANDKQSHAWIDVKHFGRWRRKFPEANAIKPIRWTRNSAAIHDTRWLEI